MLVQDLDEFRVGFCWEDCILLKLWANGKDIQVVNLQAGTATAGSNTTCTCELGVTGRL